MRKLAVLTFLALASPLAAKESLGVFSDWAAFRDTASERCYGIAKPRGDNPAYATIATYPKRQIRNQVYFRLSRAVPRNGNARVRIGGRNYALTASGRNAWAKDRAGDAAIVAAMRSATTMRVSGAGFADTYTLAGSATAMDAATVACARRR